MTLMNANVMAFTRRFALLIALSIGIFSGPQASWGQQDLSGFKDQLKLGLPGQDSAEAPIPTIITKLDPVSARPGDVVTLTISFELPEEHYIYSMNPAFGGGTSVKFDTLDGLEPQGEFVADHPPKTEYVKEFEQEVEKYTKAVTWTRKYQIKNDATAVRLKGLLKYQICNTSSCRNLKSNIDLSVQLAAAGNPAAPAVIAKRESPESPDNPFELKADLKRNKNVHPLVRLTPSNAQPGDEVSLEVQLNLEPEWHTFSMSQPEGNSAAATEFSIDTHDGLEAIDADFTANKDFKIHVIDIESKGKKEQHRQEIYEESVTWARKFRLLPDKQMSDVKVTGKVLFQTCKDGFGCIPNSVKFTLPTTKLVAAAPPPTRGGSNNTPPREGPGGAVVEGPVPVPENVNPETINPGLKDLSGSDCVASTGDGDIRDRGVLYVLGAAFVFGWLALLTPCVFPMVPITVSFFLKQAEKKHASPLRLALVYCFSIIATFTVLGLIVSALFGATYINSLANGVLINLFLGIVLLFFALNLLGLFDIQIPSWLLTFTASKESTGSYFGVFFMALTFTLTSFTCTFAFLGLILVWAANGEFWWPLGGLIAFSTAFAMPFFLLALFPSYLQKLPKSGGWMNRVKVVMGLIEMAFMFKFLSVADIAWNSTPTLLDYHLVMSAWMAISVVAGLYLIGKIQLPHDTKEDYVGVIPMVVALGFFGLAGYLAVGIFGHEPPGGFFGQQIIAFAPPRFEGGVSEDGPFLIDKHDRQRYLLDYEHAKAKAKREGLPLFIDFTGVNCINCRKMEAMMADSSAIQGKLQQLVRVKLYTDVMPKEAVGDLKRSEELLEYNGNLQETWLKDATLPGYAVVSPDGTVIFSKIKGLVPEADFNTFLECGLNKSKSKGTEVASTLKP